MDVSFVNSVRSEKKQPQHYVHGLFWSPFFKKYMLIERHGFE